MEYYESDVTNIVSVDDWEEDFIANYDGSERKSGLVSPDGRRFLIKYSKEHAKINSFDTSYVNNVLSEFISSHVLDIIGFDVHNTFVCTRQSEVLVACENFTSNTTSLIEFSKYLKKHYYSNEVDKVPSLKHIYTTLRSDSTLKTKADEFIASYWDQFVADAFIGNFDRHAGNWGYLVNMKKEIRTAPIYDNGSTLFPALSEEGMKDILSNDTELMKRIFLFPKAALKGFNSKTKLSYYDVLNSGFDNNMIKAILRVVPGIVDVFDNIIDFIESLNFLSITRKKFYITILNARLKYLLIPAYNRCLSGDFDIDALNRVTNEIPYTEELFYKQLRATKNTSTSFFS